MEIWKDIKEFEGLYKISNQGRIKSLYCNRILKPGGGRYKVIELFKDGKGKYFKVHWLVAIHFLPPNIENKSQINHKDGNKQNNNDWNLEWSTGSENVIHAYANNLITVTHGSDRYNSKLNDKKIKDIIKEYSTGNYTDENLGKKYGVSRALIWRIRHKKTWKHI